MSPIPRDSGDRTREVDKWRADMGIVKIRDGSNAYLAEVLSNGSLSVVQHSHVDSSTIHFHVDNLAAGTYRYILVDCSDTINYHHENNDHLHMEWFEIQVDSSNTGDYTVNLGFLENVDATNGDYYVVKHWSKSKTVGNQLQDNFNLHPNGWEMKSTRNTTTTKSLNDVNYQTDVNLPSTTSPTVANTPSGDGDIVLEVIVNAGVINVSVELGYHGHTTAHK